MNRKRKICTVLVVLLAFLLTGCGSLSVTLRLPDQESPEEPPELRIRVELELPEAWKEAEPKPMPPLVASPEGTPGTKRTEAIRASYPEPVPCFKINGFGCARPYDALTRAEAREALLLLLKDASSEQKAGVRRALAQGTGEFIRAEEWAAALAAIYGPGGSVPEAETIARLDAASRIAAHYELSLPEDESHFYLDLPINEETLGFACLLEPGTLRQEEVQAQTLDGYYWNQGYLFKVDDEGHSIPNVEDGALTFDASGRYRSGDEELDRLVAETLQPMISYGEDRFELLRNVFYYCRDSNHYVGYHNHDYSYEEPNGPDGWAIPVAKDILAEHKGNCYCFAAEFTYLARGLGYQVYTRGGFITGYTAHGWCELLDGNRVYICDPELEWNRHTQGEWLWDFFYRSYEELAAWSYKSSVPAPYDTTIYS